MGSVVIVVLLPGSDLLPGLGQRREQGFVQKLVPEAAVETLDKGVLHWLSRRDVVPVNPGFLAPSEHRHTGQFCAVVADYGLGLSASRYDRLEFSRDTQPGKRRVSHQRQAFSAKVI